MSFLHKLTDSFRRAGEDALPDNETEHSAVCDDNELIECGEEEYASRVFENSLDEFSQEDVTLNETAVKAEKIPLSEIFRRIMFWFFLASFVVSMWQLIENLQAKQKGEAIYSQLENEFFSGGFSIGVQSGGDKSSVVGYLAPDRAAINSLSLTDRSEGNEGDTVVNTGGYNEELEKMRAGLSSLAAINPDVYGWISIEGTEINYPIVQGEDNDYYLDHAYTGDYLPIGSIFADFRNNAKVTKNYNTILYGHNLTSGAMFHDVTKFFEDEYFNETLIYVYTNDGIFVYEPFAVYQTRYDYNYFRTSFKTPDEFIEFANEIKSHSAKEKDMEFGENDRLLTLSTCTNGAYYERYALHAKLVQTITD